MGTRRERDGRQFLSFLFTTSFFKKSGGQQQTALRVLGVSTVPSIRCTLMLMRFCRNARAGRPASAPPAASAPWATWIVSRWRPAPLTPSRWMPIISRPTASTTRWKCATSSGPPAASSKLSTPFTRCAVFIIYSVIMWPVRRPLVTSYRPQCI